MNPTRIISYLLLVAGLGSVAIADPANAKPAKQPNILFILTDDQGYGDLGRHGHPLLETPHTDRLHDMSVYPVMIERGGDEGDPNASVQAASHARKHEASNAAKQ